MSQAHNFILMTLSDKPYFTFFDMDAVIPAKSSQKEQPKEKPQKKRQKQGKEEKPKKKRQKQAKEEGG